MKKSFYLLPTLFFSLFLLANHASAQCITWSAPSPPSTYNDFNNIFLGAPCDAGNGCPFNEITSFEVFASEAYICNNFKAGGTYAFSICNGPGAGTWIPEFTILGPSGQVVAYGPGDGDSCTITWTAPVAGNYIIVINEAGHCPGGPNTNVGNGYPALTCISGAICSTTPCNAGVLTTTGHVSACGPNATFDISTDGSEVTPGSGGHGWYFSDELGGTGGVTGGFTLTGVPYSGTFDADLNGVLSANSLQPLVGTWSIKSVTYIVAGNPSNTVCSTSEDSLIVSFSPTPSPTVTVMDNGNSSATATAMGGTTPYSYLWSNGQTSATATSLPTGDYSVVVSDVNGCTGTASVSVISGVNDREAASIFDILPNPTNGVFRVKMITATAENILVSILDATGRVIETSKNLTANGEISFNLAGQPAGVYLVKLTVGEATYARRLVLTR